MKEIGIVRETKGRDALVEINRHSACGDCQMCEVSKDKQTMKTFVKNMVNAQVGDNVAVEMNFSNVFWAVLIMYGIPLVTFLLGCGLGYFLSEPLQIDQVLTAFGTGVLFMVVTYVIIHFYEVRGTFSTKGFSPHITEILAPDDEAKK